MLFQLVEKSDPGPKFWLYHPVAESVAELTAPFIPLATPFAAPEIWLHIHFAASPKGLLYPGGK